MSEVSGRKSWSQVSDTDLEGLIRALPARRPAAGVRERVLALASRRARPAAWLRPAVALGALAVLLLLDALTLSWQERSIRRPIQVAQQVSRGTSPPVPLSARPFGKLRASGEGVPDDWLDELGPAGTPYMFAHLRSPNTDGETYLQLRSRMLKKAEGG